MISFDTNLLLYALNRDCPEHRDARSFFDAPPAETGRVAICELVLIELYVLLRNPAVIKNPLNAPDAAALIQTFRRHPTWALIDYPGPFSGVMENVWQLAAQPNVGRRAVFDARLALTLRHHGVNEFATRNTSHFADLGFARVWNPLPG